MKENKEQVKEEFDLSKKLDRIILAFREDCTGCEYNKPKIKEMNDLLKEFIRLCEDNSEEINNTSYVKVSTLQRFAGDKLNGK